MIDKEKIETAKAFPIVELAKSLGIEVGRDNKALCPFHIEKTPSLSFDKRTNLFKCFGCVESGDTICKVVPTVKTKNYKI